MEEEEEEKAQEVEKDVKDEEITGEFEEGEPPPPPLPEQEKELLFLIEFLVDTLTVIPENMNVENIDPCALQGPTSVTLTFLHFPPMLISEKDVDPNRTTGGNFIQYNAGKSLMFALTESQFETPPAIFLAIAACREMPHAFRLPRVHIGKVILQLSELFKQVFEKYDENPGKVVSKSIKDSYELIGEKKQPTGSISLYVRLTCMGENVMTEFRAPEDENSTLLFKNKEGKKIYECKEKEEVEEENLGFPLPNWGGGKQPKECQDVTPPPPPDPDDEKFEEIFASINGNVIVVKAEKSKRKEKPKEFHVSDFCDCNIPLPSHLVAGLSDQSLNQLMEAGDNFSPEEGYIKTDPNVGIDGANQLVFQTPPANELSRARPGQSITYNVKTCSEGDAHHHKDKNSFKVITDNNPEGPPPQLPNDPEKDVFLLRIIKRGKGEKGQGVLQLEFKTPKEKIELPRRPPYMIDREVGPEKQKKERKKTK